MLDICSLISVYYQGFSTLFTIRRSYYQYAQVFCDIDAGKVRIKSFQYRQHNANFHSHENRNEA